MRPVMEKRGFELRHIIYIIILIVCLIAIGIAVYMQFFKDEKIGLILGITKEQEDEEIKQLKENFLNIFDNSIDVVSKYNGNVKKIKEDEDVVLVAYNTQEQEENYSVDFKIPYFNIDSETARNYNQQIKSLFKDKSESVLSSTSRKNVIFNVKYKVYENNNILSLVILSELKEGNSNERIIIQTYNYNLETNQMVNVNDIIKQKNINTANANNKIKNEINNSQEQNIKLAELGYNVTVRDTNKDEFKIENATEYFLGKNGYLYVIYAYGNDDFTSELDVIIFK